MATGPEFNDDRYRNFRMSVQGLAGDVGTGTCSSNAVTINDLMGLITTESLSTSAAGEQAIALTNSKIAAGDLVFATVGLGTATEGTPGIASVTTAAGSATITVTNFHATQAFNGTLKVGFMVVKALS